MGASLSTVAGLALALLAADCLTEAPPSPPPQTDVTLIVSPTELDFGQLYVPQEGLETIEVSNVGADSLQLSDVGIDGPAEFVVLDTDFPRLVAPGESTDVLVAFRPTVDASLVGTLVVRTNDHERPIVTLPVRGDGLAPTLEITPESFDFGTPRLGCAVETTVWIGNTGRAPLDVSGISYEVIAGAGMTLVDGNPESFVLNPSESTSVSIFFAPVDVLPTHGELLVETSAPNLPDGVASQDGMGVAGPVQIDVTTQTAFDAVDILLVLDNSSSMADEQAVLAVAMDSWAASLLAKGLDFQLGVTSTDIGDAGQLQGSVPIVTPATPDPGGTIAANTNIGIGGSGTEQGLHQVYQALEAAINDVGLNGGFLRDGALLQLLFVSDEQDQSSSIMGWTPVDYVSYFQWLKDDPSRVHISDVTGGMAGCSGAGGSAASGSDYVTATNLTGGVSAAICDLFWPNTLESLDWLQPEPVTLFPLSQMAVESSILVRVEGSPMELGWFYDSALNAVRFQDTSVPNEGAVVEIEYTIADCP